MGKAGSCNFADVFDVRIFRYIGKLFRTVTKSSPSTAKYYKPPGAGFNPATQSIFITEDFAGEIDFDETKLETEDEDRHAFLAEVAKGK